jgi:hypothetical protein
MTIVVGALKVVPKLAYNKIFKKWMNIIMHNQKQQK